MGGANKHPHETLPEYTQFAGFAQALWQELLMVKGGCIEIGALRNAVWEHWPLVVQ